MVIVLVAGSVAAAVAVLGMGLLMPAIVCPKCGQKQPRFRVPRDRHQAAQGGWTCSNCGCQMDRYGKTQPGSTG